MSINRLALVLPFMLLCVVLPSCQRPAYKRPAVVLTDSAGRPAKEFELLDMVAGSFSRLRPNARYNIDVMRSDGRRISHSEFTADRRGIIPTTVLWSDIGVEYGESRVGTLDLEGLSAHEYWCELREAGTVVAKIPLHVRQSKGREPMIYSSNREGRPQNGFALGDESVFVTGTGFPPRSKLVIRVVPDRYSWDSWEIEDRSPSEVPKPVEVELDDRQDSFTIGVWNGRDAQIGSYDILVDFDDARKDLPRHRLIRSIYPVGFTFFKPWPWPPPAAHIQTELACQAPPQDPGTGTVIDAPNPVYKDVFAPVEEVWVAVNPNVGSTSHTGQTARLYVLNHQPESGWPDGTTLTDVSSDSYETVVLQGSCANVNYTRVWPNPDIREEGYDVVVDFPPFGVYNRGQDIIDSLDPKGFVVPAQWICLESVSFNHDSSSTMADALSIRTNYAHPVVVPEWQQAKKSYPAAYVKSRNVTVRATFKHAAGVNTAQVRAEDAYGSFAGIGPTGVTFSGTSTTVSLPLASATPDRVKRIYLRWKWYVGDVNGAGSSEVHLADSVNTVFVVLAEPQAPWTASGQRQPWADVLTKSCSWASEESTAVGAATKVTQILFNNAGGLYDICSGAPSYGGAFADFQLTSFVNSFSAVGDVNCYDMGHAVVTYANVLGCGLSYRFSQPFGYLNCIHAIGRGWTNNPFYCSNPANAVVPEDDVRTGFGNHAFGSIGDNIFDACLTVDTDTNPDNCSGHNETWMINEPWSGYKTKVVDDNPPSTTGYPSTPTFGIY